MLFELQIYRTLLDTFLAEIRRREWGNLSADHATAPNRQPSRLPMPAQEPDLVR
jgi:hypothetical protein